MKDKIIVWRGTDGDIKPVKLYCVNKFGHPNYCMNEKEELEQMWGNTHFRTEKEAWKSITESVVAGVSLAGREVEQRKNDLEKAYQRAGEATVDFIRAMGNPDNPYRK